MSMERMSELRNEDQKAAMELLQSDEFLRNDSSAQRVVETGKADSGIQVDLGEFLAARGAFIRQEVARAKLSKINPEMVRVVTGVRPDVEKYTEE